MVVGFHIESIDITAKHSASVLIVGTREKIIFTCTVEVLCSGPCGDTNVTFRWIKDSLEVFSESVQEVSLAENSTIHQEMVVINRELVVADAGSYYCQAELSETTAVNSTTAKNISVARKYMYIRMLFKFLMFALLVFI